MRLVDANQEDQEASGEEFLIIETIFIGELDGGENQAGRWQEKIGVGQTDVNFKLDTGAQANILPLAMWETAVPDGNLSATKVVLTAFGEGKVQPVGMAVIPCKHN